MKKRHAVWLAVGALAIAAILALSMPASPVKATIGSDELAKLQASGAMVVDVRTPPEFEAGHIPSAVNVPVDQLPQGAATWDHDKPVVVYCATGARSADAAALLAGEGFKKVYDSMNTYMKDGYAWSQVAELGYDSFMVRHNR